MFSEVSDSQLPLDCAQGLSLWTIVMSLRPNKVRSTFDLIALDPTLFEFIGIAFATATKRDNAQIMYFIFMMIKRVDQFN